MVIKKFPNKNKQEINFAKYIQAFMSCDFVVTELPFSFIELPEYITKILPNDYSLAFDDEININNNFNPGAENNLSKFYTLDSLYEFIVVKVKENKYYCIRGVLPYLRLKELEKNESSLNVMCIEVLVANPDRKMEMLEYVSMYFLLSSFGLTGNKFKCFRREFYKKIDHNYLNKFNGYLPDSICYLRSKEKQLVKTKMNQSKAATECVINLIYLKTKTEFKFVLKSYDNNVELSINEQRKQISLQRGQYVYCDHERNNFFIAAVDTIYENNILPVPQAVLNINGVNYRINYNSGLSKIEDLSKKEVNSDVKCVYIAIKGNNKFDEYISQIKKALDKNFS